MSSPQKYSTIGDGSTMPRQQQKEFKEDESTKDILKRIFSTKIVLDNTLVKIEFWDFGGQFGFYTTHHSLLSYRSQYLLVLDLSKDLANIVQEEDIDPLKHRRLSVKGN